MSLSPSEDSYSPGSTPDTVSETQNSHQTSFDENTKSENDSLLRSFLMKKEEFVQDNQAYKSQLQGERELELCSLLVECFYGSEKLKF